MLKIFSIIFLLITFESSVSQIAEEWVARDSGIYGQCITTDDSGNSYVAGIGNGKYRTIKYDFHGNVKWIAEYSIANNPADYPVSIALDNQGNVYVAGYSRSMSGDYDYATIKYNSSGMQQWVSRYGSPDSTNIVKSMALDSMGNVYVAGYDYRNGFNVTDGCLIKYNSSGVRQWVRKYIGPDNLTDRINSIAVDNTGNVCATGYSERIPTEDDALTIKYDSDGNQLWVALYDSGNFEEKGNSIDVDVSGNVYVTGNSSNLYLTIKYNSSGNMQWAELFGTSLLNTSIAVGLDLSGNVYVTGFTYGAASLEDYTTIKYNSSGVQQWIKYYNGTGNSHDLPHAMKVDDSGNVYITGESFGTGNDFQSDFATVKYNSQGTEQWVARYNGPENNIDIPYSIALDLFGNVFVTGYSTDSTSGTFTSIKYSQMTGINQISTELPSGFSISQNYPNPFNPNTKIKFEISQTSQIALFVYDVCGKVIADLVDEVLQSGTYEIEFKSNDLPSGVYFYKIETGLFTATKKMLLLR